MCACMCTHVHARTHARTRAHIRALYCPHASMHCTAPHVCVRRTDRVVVELDLSSYRAAPRIDAMLVCDAISCTHVCMLCTNARTPALMPTLASTPTLTPARTHAHSAMARVCVHVCRHAHVCTNACVRAHVHHMHMFTAHRPTCLPLCPPAHIPAHAPTRPHSCTPARIHACTCTTGSTTRVTSRGVKL